MEFNQRPYALNVFPTGTSSPAEPVKILQSNSNIVMTALKKGENQPGYVARFYNGTNHAASTDFSIGKVGTHIEFKPYEVKTVIYDGETMTVGDEMRI